MVSLSEDGAPIQTTVNVTFQEIDLRISEDEVSEQMTENMRIMEQNANAALISESEMDND